MKKFLVFIALLSAFSLLIALPFEKVRDFGENPGNLRMFQYTPADADLSKARPLVLVLHGSMLSARSISLCGGWNKLADALDFSIIYPEQRFSNNVVRAFNVRFGRPEKKLEKETLSMRHMIGYMQENYHIDPDRIYITGLSAGGSMSNAMLYRYPELFEAAALIAAPSVMPLEMPSSAAKLPRVAVIQGNNDKVVPPENADALMEQWTALFGFEPEKGRVIENYLGNPLLTARVYTKDSRAVLIRLDAEETGHQLLIDPGNGPDQGGSWSVYSKDIDFHLPRWIISFFGLTK